MDATTTEQNWSLEKIVDTMGSVLYEVDLDQYNY
jgi:hypothetical protein